MEQRDAEMFFQLLDARGNDGFGDADLARRVRKALRLRHAHERFDAEYQVHPFVLHARHPDHPRLEMMRIVCKRARLQSSEPAGT